MGKLIYSVIASLDGYIEDEAGRFDWARPDPEVHAFVNDLERPIGIHLYGRRMYETMVFWETAGADLDPVSADYAEIWRSAEKIVISRTLASVASARTRIEPKFEREAIRRLKHDSETDVSIGGAQLAGQAMAAGLIDELHLLVVPTAVGGGKPAFPVGPVALTLLDERRFASGVVHLHYGVRHAPAR